MDSFNAICTALGVALSLAIVIGAILPPIMPSWGAIAGAIPIAVIAGVAVMGGADEPVWPAIPIGLAAAFVAAPLSREIAAGAARRAAGPDSARSASAEQQQIEALSAQPPAGLVLIFVIGAALGSVASVFVPPAALVIAGAVGWLSYTRRKRGAKYAGLRILD